MKTFKFDRLSLAVASALGFTGAVHAQVVINDTLNGTSSSYDWKALNGACLTAGTSFTISSTNSIPACRVGSTNLSYYGSKTLVGGATGKLPDASGAGALRLTNGDTSTGGSDGTNQTGAIVSNFTFPTNEGLQVTWTSVTYGGNAYQNNHGSTNSDGTAYNNKSGADGISFFLSDGGTTASPNPPTVGALGGSLGYSCSNGNGTYDGVVGGYIGIGMDEFGNFANKGDNTSSGPGQTAGAITVRGAGHTAWSWLNANYPAWYPSSLSSSDRAVAVHQTCNTGLLYNYSGASVNVQVPLYYYANFSYTRNGNTTTGYITGSSAFPSSSNCNTDGTPNTLGNRSCTYTGRGSSTSQSVASGSQIPSNIVGSAYKLDFNYPWLSTNLFPQGSYIFNQEALGTSNGASKAVRGNATPITYSLLITQAGLMTFSYAINGGSTFTVFNGVDITASNGPLPASFRFGFSAGTGGGSNVHEITCFKAAPANASGSTAGSNVQGGRVQSDSQIYLAYYHPINSWGALTAQNLVFTPATATARSTLTVSPTVNWDAGCVLTGGQCLSQGNATVTAPLDYTTRTILSWDGTKGIPFRWGNLTTGTGSQQAALTAGDVTSTGDRLDYLRGKRTLEGAGSTAFRTRTSLLGDLIDSSPVWVGPPTSPYGAAWSDLLNPAASMPEGTSYGTFVAASASRMNVVYAGANDGMLHGFQAGFYNNGTLDTASNTGKEVLAYVPSQIVSTIHSTNDSLDFSDPSYSHNFYLDASPGSGDLYYGGAWHTWVVSGLGPGGQANGPINDTTTTASGTVFALDVTDPTKFVESSAAAVAKAEWSTTSLNAMTCPGGGLKCGDHLGATYGTPLIRRLHDGTWGVIFGNGLNSKLGTAGLYIVHINPTDGSTQSVQFLDTGRGSPTAMNGIVQPTAVDLDGDHITDYVYAGDLQGNVWRFDLTAATSTAWVAPSAPSFTTQAGQPITSGVAVDALIPAKEDGSAAFTKPIVIVAFGTGQKLPKTLVNDTKYPSGQQSLYGFWDANMTGWNAKAGSQFQYAALTTLPAIVPGSGTSGNMLQHTIVTSGGNRTTDMNVVCWSGTTACTSRTNNQMGWELDLTVKPASGSTPASAEQALFNPLIVTHYFNTNTDIPVVAQALTCDTNSETGYSMAVAMATGGANTGLPGQGNTPGSGDSNYTYFTNGTPSTIGLGTQATGTSTLVTAQDGTSALIYQQSGGGGGTSGVNPLPNGTGTSPGERLNWTKMR